MPTDTELLRRAAARLDELAATTSPEPWHTHPEPECEGGVWAREGYGMVATGAGGGNAAYIAAMHPGVGKALAAWLRTFSGVVDSDDAYAPAELEHAIAVAREILGEDA